MPKMQTQADTDLRDALVPPRLHPLRRGDDAFKEHRRCSGEMECGEGRAAWEPEGLLAEMIASL
jgi:hypothetical protein